MRAQTHTIERWASTAGPLFPFPLHAGRERSAPSLTRPRPQPTQRPQSLPCGRAEAHSESQVETQNPAPRPPPPSLFLTISTAQQASPNVIGHIDPVRAQLTRSSTLDTTNSAAGEGALWAGGGAAAAELADVETARAAVVNDAAAPNEALLVDAPAPTRDKRARAAVTAGAGGGGGMAWVEGGGDGERNKPRCGAAFDQNPRV